VNTFPALQLQEKCSIITSGYNTSSKHTYHE
jgi:hypothetical protein